MNKIFLLILLSNSILMGMENGKRILEPDATKPKNVSFSNEALEKLAITQKAIDAVNNPLTPPSIPRTKLSPGERYPTRPELAFNKLTMPPHRDSVPDIDGQTVASVRKPKMPRDDQNAIQ